MERIFQIAAAVLIGSAAVFFLRGSADGVFLSLVLGCLSFFLSVRVQVRQRLSARERELEAEQERTAVKGSRYTEDAPADSREKYANKEIS